MTNEDTLCNFEPADFNACGSELHEYKRLFEIHLDANGRYGVDGREKVRQLLKCMGQQSTEYIIPSPGSSHSSNSQLMKKMM